MKKFALKILVGKNIPHLARLAMTALGSLILTSSLFSPETVALDPALGEAATQIQVPSEAEVKDGLTGGELAGVALGLLLVWASRLLSFARAQNLDWLAKIAGPFIGRSVPSLFRAILIAIGAAGAWFTKEPAAAPEVIADHPLSTLLASVMSVLFANFLSSTEDAKRNPVT